MKNYIKKLFVFSGLIAFAATIPAFAQSVIGEQSGRIEWNGWALDYDMFEFSDGLILRNIEYNGRSILGRASFPVMSVYYEGPCGPYADRLNGVQQPVSWANNELLVAREFTQNGVQWFELGIREFIGSYDIYQVWYLSENGELDGHTFSRGVQCNYNHVHYPMWRFDFDIDGSANDRILRSTSADSVEYLNTEFQVAANTAFQHGWFVEDSVTGTRVRIDFDSGAWNVGGTVIPETEYENNNVGGIAYASNEIGWTGGASQDFPYINGASINNTDITLWYRGYLPHTPSEGSALWHSTGVRISVVDNNADFDADGIPDITDTDDDNDGVLDVNDDLPFNPNESVDTDADGIGNNADTDDDNDGVLDVNDVFPLDANESLDSDSDGVGDNSDTDNDNDGIADAAEYAHTRSSGTFGSYNIPPNGQSTTRSINLSSFDMVIGQTVSLSEIRAEGDLNSPSETFTLVFNDGEYSTGELQTGIQCSASLDTVTRSIDASFTVIDIGNGTPGIRVTGTTSGAVDSLSSTCAGVDFQFELVGENRLLDTDEDQIANIYDLDSDNDAVADVIEAGLNDSNDDYQVDSLSQQGSVVNPPDTDADGLPDFVDLESGNGSNDGTAFDIAGTGYSFLDTDNSGRVDAQDATGGIDSNANGIDDAIEFGTTGGNDVTAPLATIDVPTPNQALSPGTVIRGEANDEAGGSGVVRVEIAIRDLGRALWVDASGQPNASQSWITINGILSGTGLNETWTYPLSSAFPAGSYRMYARAYDLAGNVLSSYTRSGFTVATDDGPGTPDNDVTAPLATIDVPASDEAIAPGTVLRGEANDEADGSGVVRVELAIRDVGRGLWVDASGQPNASQSWIRINGILSGTGLNETWTYPLSSAFPAGSYRVFARAYDLAGNVLSTYTRSNFTVVTDGGPGPEIDVTAPLATIDVPGPDQVISPGTVIRGEANDEAGGSGVVRVELAIRDLGRGLWVDASGQPNASQSWVRIDGILSGTGLNETWTFPLTSTFPAGSYRVFARAYDQAGNVLSAYTDSEFTVQN